MMRKGKEEECVFSGMEWRVEVPAASLSQIPKMPVKEESSLLPVYLYLLLDVEGDGREEE